MISYNNQDWGYWWRDRDIDNNGTERLENSDTNPHEYAKGFLTEEQKHIPLRKNSLFKK